jgi:dienelactone hydrolase
MSEDPCCCPPNSTPSFRDAGYVQRGAKISLDEVQCYVVGSPTEGGRAIIVCPDIWGWDSGRIRRVADHLSDEGYYVVIPKLLLRTIEGGTDGDGLPPNFDLNLRGAECWPWLGSYFYLEDLKPIIDRAVAHIKSLGISNIGTLGFCYGGWVQVKLTADHPDIRCGVTVHPSIHVEEMLHGGNNVEIVKNVRQRISFHT